MLDPHKDKLEKDMLWPMIWNKKQLHREN